MAALAATDVTVTISQRNVEDRPGLLRHVIADLAFGDGALTYPSGGVPLPAIGTFGFKREIKIGLIEQPYGSLYQYVYDRTNHKIMICGASELSTPTAGAKPFYEILMTSTPAAVTLRCKFEGE